MSSFYFERETFSFCAGRKICMEESFHHRQNFYDRPVEIYGMIKPIIQTTPKRLYKRDIKSKYLL